MDSLLKCVYSNWFTDASGNRYPLPNVLPDAIFQFAHEHFLKEGSGIVESKNFLENELSRENNKDVLRFYHCNFYSFFKKYNGEHNFVDENQVDDNHTYIYPIELKNYDMLWLPQTYTLHGVEHTYTVLDTLSERLLNLLRERKVKIVASIPFEPIHDDVSGVVEFRTLLQKHGIFHDDVIVCVSGNEYVNPHNVKTYGVNLPLAQAADELYKFQQTKQYYRGGLGYESQFVLPEDLDATKVRDKKFLSFNRSMKRYHRIALAYTALKHDLLSEGIFSFLGSDLLVLSDNKFNDVHRHLNEYLDSYLNHDIVLPDGDTNQINYYTEKILNLIPYEIDTQHLSLEAKCGFTTNNNKKEFYNQTYIHITTESRFTSRQGVFFSEKTYRPIANLQPFIMIGDAGTLKELHNIGFKTFHPFIDESYDNETDNRTRFQLISKEILKLQKMSLEEIHNWYHSITDVLRYNQNLLINHYNFNPFEIALKKLVRDTNGIQK